MAFQVGATSLLFVSCHLAAHQRRIQQRNGDFERIATNLPLRAPLQRASVPREPDDARREGAVIDLFDRVVFLGDMNYRINGTRAMIDSLISSRMHEVLLFNDQLRIEMKRGRVFQGFEEGPLHFAPTYKFDANSDAYDSSKKRRIPAWTDRILFKAVRGRGPFPRRVSRALMCDTAACVRSRKVPCACKPTTACRASVRRTTGQWSHCSRCVYCCDPRSQWEPC